MKKPTLILFLLFILGLLFQTFGQTEIKPKKSNCEEPMIVKNNGKYELKLSDCIIKRINEFDSNFVSWNLEDCDSVVLKYYPLSENQLPYAVIGDFNGDGVRDLFVEGHNENQIRLLAVLSENKEYRVTEISSGTLHKFKDRYYSDLVYSYVKPGNYSTVWEDDALDLKNDAVGCAFPEKASWIYYYKDGKFLEYTTGD